MIENLKSSVVIFCCFLVVATTFFVIWSEPFPDWRSVRIFATSIAVIFFLYTIDQIMENK